MLPPSYFYSTSGLWFSFVISVLIRLLWQHYDKAGKGLGEGCTPAEGDICGLCTLPVAHPAGQPWTGAAHRRYRCCVVPAVCGVLSPPHYHCMYSKGCLIDGCIRSSRYTFYTQAGGLPQSDSICFPFHSSCDVCGFCFLNDSLDTLRIIIPSIF